MKLRNEITLMDGKKVMFETVKVKLNPQGTTDHMVKAICSYCNSIYSIRPFICRCSSNVFLQDVKNGKLI